MASTTSRKISTSPITRSTPFADLPLWLSPADVQAFLGLSRGAAYLLANSLPNRRFGKHLRISKHHLKPGGGK